MDFCIRTIHNFLTNFKSGWCKDISFLTVCIADQSDISCSIWIVLNSLNYCRNTILISFKINNSIFSSSTATTMSYSNLTLAVTTSSFLY